MNTMLDGIFMTMSTSTGLYPKLDLWTANKLQLQLQDCILIWIYGMQINYITFAVVCCRNRLEHF